MVAARFRTKAEQGELAFAPRSLAELNQALNDLTPGVAGGTRAVSGEGPVGAALALVGEQPGDIEDREGRPFVGPAGRVLDRALGDAGIVRADVYVTNAVKHFKFVERGKHRLHQKPTAGEIRYYRWWLEKELQLVAPSLVVALGASAVQALAGKPLAIERNRGVADLGGFRAFITAHPSFILRQKDAASREAAYAAFADDMRRIQRLAGNETGAA